MNALVDDSTLTYADLSEILEDVNTIRLAVGIGEGKIPRLPAGIPGDSQQCVLARALSNGWEPDVDGSFITLKNFDYETLDNFDFEEAVGVLKSKGLDASYDVEEYEEDDGSIFKEEGYINIKCTPLMSKLITEFDDKHLPSLILND